METKVLATQEITPVQMIMAAVTGQADLEKVEKLLELQERYEANQAKKAFSLSFAIAQEGMQSVKKTKVNNQTHSKYADLGDVIESAKPVYTNEGFSVVFYEGATTLQEHVRVYADVLHKLGHKETYYFDVPLDGKGMQGNANMTKIHGKASSVAYGRRYLMCMIWNIPTQDNDGQTVTTVDSVLTDAQLHVIRDLLISKDITEKKLIEHMKVARLEDVKASEYHKCVNAIKAAQKKVESK